MTTPETNPGFHIPLLAAIALVLVVLGLRIAGLSFDPTALVLITLAAVAVLTAGFAAQIPLPGRMVPAGWGRPDPGRAARTILAFVAGSGIVHHLLYSPGITLLPAKPVLFRGGAVIAGVLLALYLWQGSTPHLRKWLFYALLACFSIMGAVVLSAAPSPMIDTWVSQQGAAKALADGFNPYQLSFPNLYGEDTPFYGPGYLVNGRVMVFPYMPLTTLLELPAYVAVGEIRWLLLACMLAAGWGLARLGGRTGECAALALLFQPGTFLVLELAWTEPIVLAAVVLVLLVLARGRLTGGTALAMAGAAFGLLAASKQYSPLFIVPLAAALPREKRFPVAAVALLVLTVITLPFVLWHPAEFWRDVVTGQFLQPFRMDSLSWLAACAWWTGYKPSSAVGFVLAGLVLLSSLRGAMPLWRAAAIAAAAFLVLVLFSKQAMFNYFWLSTGLLASVVAAWAADNGNCHE